MYDIARNHIYIFTYFYYARVLKDIVYIYQLASIVEACFPTLLLGFHSL